MTTDSIMLGGATSGSQRPKRSSALWQAASTVVYPIISLGLFMVAWQAVHLIFRLPTYVLPSPLGVMRAAIEHRATLLENLYVTSWEVLFGFLLAVVVSVPLGVWMAEAKIVEKLLYPSLVASQGVPKVGLAPILVIWFGFGIMPKIVMSALIAFFPIVVSTFVGLKSCQPELKHLGRIIGFSRMAMLRKITFPGALPSVFGGMKVGVTLALVGAIVAEFVSAQKGLGHLMVITTSQLQTELMFAALAYVSVLGVALFVLLDVLERVFIPWHADKELYITA